MAVAAVAWMSVAGCEKKVAESESAAPGEPEKPAISVAAQTAGPAATATPPAAKAEAPASATAAPAKPELAPPGIFYLIEATHIETADGIVGLKPGDGVKLVRPGVYLSAGGEVPLRADQVTNDLAVARGVLQQDQATQAAIRTQLAAQARQAQAVQAARDAIPLAPPNSGQAVATPSASPLPPLGSSLARPTDGINTTHSSTKDKVYTDSKGQYWRDIYGRHHYF
jgi:hypothetical protein